MPLKQRTPRRHFENHLDFLRQLPCCICGDNTTTEAAHLRTGNRMFGMEITGGAEKTDDLFCLPLCGRHHREQHKGNEVNFWSNVGVNPWIMALKLFAASGDFELAEEIMRSKGQPR